jgi:hypothetical protein
MDATAGYHRIVHSVCWYTPFSGKRARLTPVIGHTQPVTGKAESAQTHGRPEEYEMPWVNGGERGARRPAPASTQEAAHPRLPDVFQRTSITG